MDFTKLKVKELKDFTKLYKKKKNIGNMSKSQLIEYCNELSSNSKVKRSNKVKFNELKHKLQGNGIFTIDKRFSIESKNTLLKYGQWIVAKITLKRTPVMKVLEKFIDVISLKKYSEAKGDATLFHLYAICEVVNPKNHQERVNICIEKNDRPRIGTTLPQETPQTESFNYLVRRILQLDSMMQNTINRFGESRFFIYNPLNTNNDSGNCQRWLMDVFDANKLNNISIRNWIVQDISNLAKKIPSFSQKIMNKVTDLGALSNQYLDKGKTLVKKIGNVLGFGDTNPLFEGIYDGEKNGHIGAKYKSNFEEYINQNPQIQSLQSQLKTLQSQNVPKRNTKPYYEYKLKFRTLNNDINNMKKQLTIQFNNEFKRQLIEDYVYNKGYEYTEDGKLIKDDRNAFDTLMNIPVLGKVLKYTGISDVLQKGMNSAESLYNDAKDGNIIAVAADLKNMGESVKDAVTFGKDIANKGLTQYGKDVAKTAVKDVVGLGKINKGTKAYLIQQINLKLNSKTKKQLIDCLLTL